MTGRPRAAVIGSGVSGLVAAHVLGRTHDVTLYEADERAGGHAHTHEITLEGQRLFVDSGFIVHNERTYPTLLRLFAELDVATQDTDMSMSVRHDADGVQYAGGRGLSGILADPRTVGRPAYLRMLRDVRRFHRSARLLLDRSPGAEDVSLGDWLEPQGFSDAFVEWFVRPLVAAVWSCDPDRSLEYPARSLLTFLDHHGMLSVTGSPTWRTVVGGSRAYVDRVLAGVHTVRLGCPVTGVERAASGASVTAADGTVQEYDGVVVATHPHQALALLRTPTPTERAVLGAISYSVNQAQLHTDATVLPTRRWARASWNYRIPTDPTTGVLVTYDLTRLMRLPTPGGQRVLVTLNGSGRVDKRAVLAEMAYEHPLYTTDSLAAQRRLPELSDRRVAFAGAYHGWGFHEDGALAGLRAAEALGGRW
ncbi:NAD(P)/FAD-dependent oxidoreductase [Luteipulveratus flavus]|uniref:FAD-dependent oxidoreductase n=1 Tax=Luteipulveratus flavus TaxID=3031728 RepID=A0ABT6CB36_9MICO|nr:FAD-dependent oxidoreductase [Luteipulveratus sp. YIM 133296]MDF8265269.1 FAD-dependent oxidoreductase [Luteipulveratus sp. YIM 133296]